MNPCIVAIETKDNDGDGRWMSIHKKFLQECKEKDPEGKLVLKKLLKCSVFVTNCTSTDFNVLRQLVKSSADSYMISV